MNDSHVIEFQECPHCHIQGRNKTYAVYSDGHTHCFWCKRGNRAKYQGPQVQSTDQSEEIRLPYDFQKNIPLEAERWLHLYGLETGHFPMGWSERKKRLIFPYYKDDKLLGWQGRYFGDLPTEPKWYNSPKLNEIDYELENSGCDRSSVVIVEDIVSAHRVANFSNCVPMFGTNLTGWRLKRLKDKGYKLVTFWLDNDAAPISANSYGLALVMGLNARMIITDKDPKEYSDIDIKTFLT